MNAKDKNTRVHDIANDAFSASRSKVFVAPVRSLLDLDFYKFTMGQVIHKYNPENEVTFKLKVRDTSVKLFQYVNLEELKSAFDYAMGLSFRKTDQYYLRGMNLYQQNMFSESYLDFLKGLRLPTYCITKADGVVEITFTGSWSSVTYWETIAMSIISELYYRGLMRSMTEADIHDMYVVANHRLESELMHIRDNSSARIADFGTRRRHSFAWQRHAIITAKRILGDRFTGTSNTYLAFNQDLDPIGTDAHERTMVAGALAGSDEELRNSQYDVLMKWQDVYGPGLRIFLPDTFGSAQFFRNAPDWLSTWRGQRQDSGDPIAEADRCMNWYQSRGINPEEKVTIFSDGLTYSDIVRLSNKYQGRHIVPFGWGTMLTNNFAGTVLGNENMRPFSMVVKAVEADGRPCVKLSNNPEKAMGPKQEVERYLRVFGSEGHIASRVLV